MSFSFARVFGDNMIIQRGKPFKIWGYGGKGRVTVRLDGKIARETTCVSDENGNFCAEFEKIGGGSDVYTITAKCNNQERSIKNIRFGDVFLLLGQSNISYTLSSVEKAEKYIKAGKESDISMLCPGKNIDLTYEVNRPVFPMDNLIADCSYQIGKSDDIKDFSAIGVMTSILVNRRTKIPVGFVDTSMGGLSIETYLPFGCVEDNEDLKNELKKYDRYVDKEHYNKQSGRNFTQLYGVYNERVSPLKGLEFCAVIWYLGESSAYDYGLAKCYEKELEMLILGYREIFGNIPFINVNIAPEYYFYGDGYGYLYINEAINKVSRKLENCYCIPLYHIKPRWLKKNGEIFYHPIHPVNKEPVAKRIAEIFVHNILENKPYNCLCVEKAYSENNGKYIVELSGNSPLKKVSSISGFALKDENGKYYRANGKLIGENKIELSAFGVTHPSGVSYGFSQYQKSCNVVNKNGEELWIFRTEEGALNPTNFPCPQFMDFKNSYVCENSFGFSVGTAKQYKSWKNGEIYGCINKICHIKDEKNGDYFLRFTANPTNDSYFFFGISPKICLSGENNGFSSYDYIKLKLTSEKDFEFYGIVARFANGDLCRFAPLDNGEMVDFINIERDKEYDICISLRRAFMEDMSIAEIFPNSRETIVLAEFTGRAREELKITFEDMRYIPKKLNINYKKAEAKEFRLDIVLPDEKK